jgi:hypothetical protein
MPAPDQSLGQYVHGVPVTNKPATGGNIPVHGAAVPVTTPASGAPQP